MRFPCALLGLALALAITRIGCAQTVTPSAAGVPAARPVPGGPVTNSVLSVEETRIDLGPISDERPQLHPFRLTNVSGRKIRLAIGYCHFCAPPILDKSVLNPGESATLVVELDPSGKRGPYSASATVGEEGKSATQVSVELRADICPRVWIEPTNMFPRIIRGLGASGSFTVIGRASGFKVVRVESDVPMDRIDIASAKDVEDFGSIAHSQEITVHFPKDAPLGPFAASLNVITSDEGAPTKTISVSGQVLGHIDHTIGGGSLLLKPGETFRTTFEITADESPIMLHSLDITDRDECSSVAVDVSPTPDPSRIRVTISGVAPLRERQLAVINVRAVAATLSTGGEETHDIPVLIIAKSPRPPQ